MPRLFVAIAIPRHIQQPLLKAQQLCPAKCRWVNPAKWHITLLFIGNQQVDTVHDCLQTISGESFELALSKAGYFGRINRGATFWWGVLPHPKLVALQAKIHERLQQQFGDELVRANQGDYQPHITLARCKTKVTRVELDRFLAQPALEPCFFSVQSFGLYSSVTDSAGARYTLEHVYALKTVT